MYYTRREWIFELKVGALLFVQRRGIEWVLISPSIPFSLLSLKLRAHYQNNNTKKTTFSSRIIWSVNISLLPVFLSPTPLADFLLLIRTTLSSYYQGIGKIIVSKVEREGDVGCVLIAHLFPLFTNSL